MKIRLHPFRTYTRSRTLPEATNDVEVVRAVAGELLENFELDAAVRLIGVGLAGLEGGERESAPADESTGALSLDV